MTKRRRTQPTVEEQSDAGLAAKAYWDQLRADVTSRALFIDTSAILDCYATKGNYQQVIGNFLTNEAINFRYITSTYTVCEAVRRLVHATHQFAGPQNEQGVELAVIVLKNWLKQFSVKVVCVPDSVFELARGTFEKYRNIEGWTLTDAISYEIVKGLGQRQIVSGDGGFQKLGFIIHPEEYYRLKRILPGYPSTLP